MHTNRSMVVVTIIATLIAIGTLIGVRSGVLLLPGMDTPGENAQFSEITYGPVFSRPDRYDRELFKDAWVRRIPIGNSTFGRLLVQQDRFEIEGNGNMVSRSISADTPSAAKLLDGRPRARTLRFLHGLQRVLDDRNAYIGGVSLSRSEDGFNANYLAIFVQDGSFDRYTRTLAEQRWAVKMLLRQRAVEDVLAWFQHESRWIVIGPEISQPLERALRNPASVSPRKQLRIAYVLHHEIEHSVTTFDGRYESGHRAFQMRWLEEASADTLARWPGVAAQTARELGLRYPKRAKRLAYDKIERNASGYNDLVFAMRRLLTLGGVDVNDPKALSRVERLLQSTTVEDTPARLARAIVKHQGLRSSRGAAIAEGIRRLDADPANVRRFERALRAMKH